MKKQEYDKKIILYALIPGLGQFKNGQKEKGAIFLTIFGLFCLESAFFGINALQELITLGSEPGIDNSMFLMVRGTLQLLITLIFVGFYVSQIRDAIKVNKNKTIGLPIATGFTGIKGSLATHGFPYLLTFPAYILMIFTIVLPVLVTLFMAFTNYDFNHIPPAALIDWIGIQNFKDMFFLSSYRSTFMAVFSWTLIWTLIASTLQIILGVFTATVAHQDWIKGKRIFGIIFLLPWAVPAFVTIMSFSNIFNDSAGAINVQIIPLLNKLLPFVDLSAINWMTDPFWTPELSN